MSTWTLKAFSRSTQCVQGKHGLQLEAKKRGPPGAEISKASTSRVIVHRCSEGTALAGKGALNAKP